VKARYFVLAAIGFVMTMAGFTAWNHSAPYSIEVGDPGDRCRKHGAGPEGFSAFYFDQDGTPLECHEEGRHGRPDPRVSEYFSSQEAQHITDMARQLGSVGGLTMDDQQRLTELARQLAEQKGFRAELAPSEVLLSRTIGFGGMFVIVFAVILAIIGQASGRK
jgi:hypothetical protein